jgi:hypothetical protein
MSIALGLFALSLMGIDGPQRHEAFPLTYEVRVIKIKGLEWRGDFFARLQPVSHQGPATIWTASRATAEQLAEKDPDARKATHAMATPRAVVHLTSRALRMVPSGVNRLADGPFDHATQVAYTPHYEPIHAGWALSLTGRKLDQGVLVCMVLENTDVTAVHHVNVTESMAAKSCCEKGAGCAEKAETVGSRIDVPEVAHAEIAGEWLIPNDGALVVSLGVQTTTDEAGKAVTVERLALVEAHPAAECEVRQASLSVPPPGLLPRPAVHLAPGAEAAMAVVGRIATAVPVPLPVPLPVPVTPPQPIPAPGDGAVTLPEVADVPPPAPLTGQLPMPMPAMPSRSLPLAVGADGAPQTLPPLPEEVSPPASLPGSSEPCASPQRRTPKPPDGTGVDPSSTTAGYAPETKEKEAKAPDGQSSRPCLLSFPVNAGNLNFEVEIRMASPFAGWPKARPSAASQPQK